jgi:uncharacterized repeat protein (TIGR01451 family)
MRNKHVPQTGLFVLGLVLAIALQPLPVAAQTAVSVQAKPEVESVLTSNKVTLSADKKEVLVDAKDIKPGEIMEYRATYTNKSKAPVTNLLLNLPIPPGTEYQGGSAKPASGLKATLGDGKFSPIPLKRKVKLPSGKEGEENVPFAEYRSLQWSLGELAAGKSVVVSARVRVSDVTPTVPATPASATPPPPSPPGGQK